nr:CSC1-like protein ERD4 [Ipomoea batatas]
MASRAQALQAWSLETNVHSNCFGWFIIVVSVASECEVKTVPQATGTFNELDRLSMGHIGTAESNMAILVRDIPPVPEGQIRKEQSSIMRKLDDFDLENWKLEQKVTVLRETAMLCAIVFFNSRVTAASASQSLHSPMVDRWMDVIAPIIISIWGGFTLAWDGYFLRNQALKVYVPSFRELRKDVAAYAHSSGGCPDSVSADDDRLFRGEEVPYAYSSSRFQILSFIFAFVCRKKFYRFFQSTALEVSFCRQEKKKKFPTWEIIFQVPSFPPCFGNEKSTRITSKDAFVPSFPDQLPMSDYH